jgi:hypothetical protein
MGVFLKPARFLKILMVFTHRHAYDAKSVRLAPSGGTEKTVVFLSEALEGLGHQVTLITSLSDLKAFEQEIQTSTEPNISFDVLITQEARLFDSSWAAKMPRLKKVWWCHHYPDQPIIQRNAAYGRVFADAIVTLSQTQQNAFLMGLKLKTLTIPHGVHKHELVGQDNGQSDIKKNPFQLVYASTPFRGLGLACEIYTIALQKESRLQWAIASSMNTYGDAQGDERFQGLFQTLKQLKGVKLLGALSQQNLYEVYAQSTWFFYPCTWPETYCMAMDEAVAHGCIPLVRDEGCLSERVTPIFTKKMTLDEMAEALLINLDSKESQSWIRQPVLDWQEVGQQWHQFLMSL